MEDRDERVLDQILGVTVAAQHPEQRAVDVRALLFEQRALGIALAGRASARELGVVGRCGQWHRVAHFPPTVAARRAKVSVNAYATELMS